MEDFKYVFPIVVGAAIFYSCIYLSIYIDDHFALKFSVSEILARSLTRIVSFVAILAIWGSFFPFNGSLSVFMFIVTATAIFPSKYLRKMWHNILPGKSFRLLPFFAVLFFAIGFIFIPNEWKGQSNPQYSQIEPAPSPTNAPAPTATPNSDYPLVYAPTCTPTPAPTQSHRDGPGISFEEFMQGFEEYKQNGGEHGLSYEEFMQGYEEYKRNGGASYTDTWGEDRTTNEITGALGTIAYWTPNGKSYHFSLSCPSLSRSNTVYYGTLQDALNAGKTDPCNNCAYG